MTTRFIWSIFPLIGLAIGCMGPEEFPPKAPSAIPAIPTASCGALHEWVPIDQTGEPLMTVKDTTLSMTAEGLSTLVEAFELNGISPRFDVTVYQSRYTSQDRGQVIEGSGWFAHPNETDTYPLMIWMHPTAGFTPDCGPSARGIEGAVFAMLFASLGYVVAAPDYVGMNGWAEPSSADLHPYITAEPTAVASLDSARALLIAAEDKGWSARPDPSRTVLYGASEGGFAALVADRYAAALAPEITPAVVMASVPPTDLRELAFRGTNILGETSSGLAAIVTTMDQWYGTDAIETVLQPDFAQAVEDLLGSTCYDFSAGDPQALEEIFQPSFIEAAQGRDWEAVEPWGCILEENSPRTMPVQGNSEAVIALLTSDADDLAWSPPVHDTIVEWCNAGREVIHRQCAGLDHSTAGVVSVPWQMDTIAGLLDGSLSATCEVSAPEPCE
jgi:dienelactone hydrolase